MIILGRVEFDNFQVTPADSLAASSIDPTATKDTASLVERRSMALSRFGLTEIPKSRS